VLADVREASSVTDYYLVASGSSSPHLKAMINELHVVLKQHGVTAQRMAGTPESGWLTLDCIDVVIHIFLRPTRAYYAIEALWAEAPRLA
jgi:ribosome-associated protein